MDKRKERNNYENFSHQVFPEIRIKKSFLIDNNDNWRVFKQSHWKISKCAKNSLFLTAEERGKSTGWFIDMVGISES